MTAYKHPIGVNELDPKLESVDHTLVSLFALFQLPNEFKEQPRQGVGQLGTVIQSLANIISQVAKLQNTFSLSNGSNVDVMVI